MPTYWYRCQNCKHEFEEFQKITDSPVRKCPKCDGVVMRVITGGAGLIFKGSGFYITDYRSDSYKKAEAAEKSSSSSSAVTNSTKSGSSGKTKD
ncbi:MAG: zinc ribbon domain-containing protein [candidate division Zixibacteria bacterium]|nr:zinc ribbon domain-containing protein [candidate division Zixibacteria bacterium]